MRELDPTRNVAPVPVALYKIARGQRQRPAAVLQTVGELALINFAVGGTSEGARPVPQVILPVSFINIPGRVLQSAPPVRGVASALPLLAQLCRIYLSHRAELSPGGDESPAFLFQLPGEPRPLTRHMSQWVADALDELGIRAPEGFASLRLLKASRPGTVGQPRSASKATRGAPRSSPVVRSGGPAWDVETAGGVGAAVLEIDLGCSCRVDGFDD